MKRCVSGALSKELFQSLLLFTNTDVTLECVRVSPVGMYLSLNSQAVLQQLLNLCTSQAILQQLLNLCHRTLATELADNAVSSAKPSCNQHLTRLANVVGSFSSRAPPQLTFLRQTYHAVIDCIGCQLANTVRDLRSRATSRHALLGVCCSTTTHHVHVVFFDRHAEGWIAIFVRGLSCRSRQSTHLHPSRIGR